MTNHLLGEILSIVVGLLTKNKNSYSSVAFSYIPTNPVIWFYFLIYIWNQPLPACNSVEWVQTDGMKLYACYLLHTTSLTSWLFKHLTPPRESSCRQRGLNQSLCDSLKRSVLSLHFHSTTSLRLKNSSSHQCCHSVSLRPNTDFAGGNRQPGGRHQGIGDQSAAAFTCCCCSSAFSGMEGVLTFDASKTQTSPVHSSCAGSGAEAN